MSEKSPEVELFENMVKVGFEPMKQMIEYRHLEDQLSEQDIEMVTKILGQNLNSWILWLQHVKKQTGRTQ